MAAPGSRGSLSSMTRGSPPPRCAASASAAMEEASTPSRAARRSRTGRGPGRAFGRGVEDDAEAVLGGHARGSGVDPGEELVGQRGHDEQRRPGAPEAQVARGEVGPVAQLAGGLATAARSARRPGPATCSPARARRSPATPRRAATSRLVGGLRPPVWPGHCVPPDRSRGRSGWTHVSLMVRMTLDVIRKTSARRRRGRGGTMAAVRGLPPDAYAARLLAARWSAGCRTPWPPSRSCCSSAPRAAATPSRARSRPSTGWPWRPGSRCSAGR